MSSSDQAPPRLERFREHNIELPVAELSVSAQSETSLREALHRALDYGKGLVQVLPLGRDANRSAGESQDGAAGILD